MANGIQVSPTSLSFTAKHGGVNPPNQPVQVTTTPSTMNWWTMKNEPWLTVTPPSHQGVGEVEVGVNISGLSVGTHSGEVDVYNAFTFVKIPVTLTITA